MIIFDVMLVKDARHGNCYRYSGMRYTPEVQGYEKILLDRKGSSQALKEHHFYFTRLITPLLI